MEQLTRTSYSTQLEVAVTEVGTSNTKLFKESYDLML